MENYFFTKHADRDLQKLPRDLQRRIIEKIEFYINTGRPFHYADVVQGKNDRVWRWRVGDWRVTFDLTEKGFRILKVEPKPRAYRS